MTDVRGWTIACASGQGGPAQQAGLTGPTRPDHTVEGTTSLTAASTFVAIHVHGSLGGARLRIPCDGMTSELDLTVLDQSP